MKWKDRKGMTRDDATLKIMKYIKEYNMDKEACRDLLFDDIILEGFDYLITAFTICYNDAIQRV